MCFSRNRSRNGDYHEYYFCIGRQQRRTDCQLPYLRADAIEDQILAHYRRIRLDPQRQAAIRDGVAQFLDRRSQLIVKQAASQARRIHRLEAERKRLVEAYVADAIPLDLLKAEQDRITRELEDARRLTEATDQTTAMILKNLDVVLGLLDDPQGAYRQSGPISRRMWNQALFDRIEVDADTPPRSHLADVFAHVHAEGPWARKGPEPKNHGQDSPDRGSKEDCLVGPAGFEPATNRL